MRKLEIKLLQISSVKSWLIKVFPKTLSESGNKFVPKYKTVITKTMRRVKLVEIYEGVRLGYLPTVSHTF